MPVGAMDSRWLLRMPSLRIACLDVVGQARGERAGFQIALRIEQRKRAALAREFHRRAIRLVAHRARDARGEVAAFLRVVAQAEHHERIAQAREAQADAPLGLRLASCCWQRPERDVEHVVEQAHCVRVRLREAGPVERRRAAVHLRERIAHEAREVERPEVAAAVGGQRLLAARIGRAIVSKERRLLSSFMRDMNTTPGSARS